MVDGIGDHLEESAADGVCDDWFCFSGNPGQQQWCCNFSRNAVCIVWHVCERWQKNGMLLAVTLEDLCIHTPREVVHV